LVVRESAGLVVVVPEVVVVVDAAVPEAGTLDLVAPGDGVVFVAGTGWVPPEPATGAGALGGAPAVGVVGDVAGADGFDVTPPVLDVPPPEPPPPPLEGATGVTPGQASAKAPAGVTDGFVALGLSAPGFW
jgi:hypothetical protein